MEKGDKVRVFIVIVVLILIILVIIFTYIRFTGNAIISSIYIDKISLIDADRDVVIQGFEDLRNGGIINLANLPTRNITIAAFVGGNVKSIIFGLDNNQNYRYEGSFPYSISGDDSGGNYRPWNVPLGTHVLNVTPYSTYTTTGDRGESKTIRITFVKSVDIDLICRAASKIYKEGWYLNGRLLKEDDCSCESVCENANTPQEGWYSSCDSSLIVLNDCDAQIVVKQCNDGIDNDGDGLIDLADLGCDNENDDDEYNAPIDSGWTVFREGPDTKKIYVSSSDGNDNNDGSSPNSAVKTIERAKELARDGYPDWILLKKGDSWNVSINWDKGGTPNAKMLITSYGTGTRPIIQNYKNKGSDIISIHRSNIAIVGIHFRGYYNTTRNRAGIGILVNPYDNLLVENSYFEGVTKAIDTHNPNAGNDFERSGLALRRSVIATTYAEGIYISGTRNVLIEGNIFYHNDWHEGELWYYDRDAPIAEISSAGRTHGAYIQYYNDNVVVRDNIFASQFEGLTLRSGGIVENNFFVRNNRGMTIMTRTSAVRNNVFLQPLITVQGQSPRSIEVMPINRATIVEGNIVSKSINASSGNAFIFHNKLIPLGNDSMELYRIQIVQAYDVIFRNNIAYNGGHALLMSEVNKINNISIKDNIFYNMLRSSSSSGLCFQQSYASNRGNVSYDNNIFWCRNMSGDKKYIIDKISYSFSDWKTWAGDTTSREREPIFNDAERTIESYHQSIGKTGSYDDFVRELLKQSKDNWRVEYTADAVNDYIRDGFTILGYK